MERNGDSRGKLRSLGQSAGFLLAPAASRIIPKYPIYVTRILTKVIRELEKKTFLCGFKIRNVRMIHPNLINPKSILVVGGSNNVHKPGGKLVDNLIKGNFKGTLAVVNPKEDYVQGLKSYRSIELTSGFDLVFLAIPAKYCLATVEYYVNLGTKAFIIISAGFGEVTEEGKKNEQKIAQIISDAGGTLIGPNCIGIINENYHGVFTTPIPNLSKEGCDLISSSGSTAVFIMEKAVSVGLRFSSVITVGNAAQTSVEDVLAYLDTHFDPQTSSKIIMIYVEDIHEPPKFLKHAASLIEKGCKIAAIKAGVTEAGSRAASSHTGAMASSDMVVRALFRKAGIVYCSSREELITVASIFKYRKLMGPNIAVITHAGGTAVLLTDSLEKGGLQVPAIPDAIGQELKTYLDAGSSVKNPIDFLATGTADQLGIIIDYVEHKMDFIQGMVVVFGSPGLFNVKNVYQVLNVKMDVCSKPIYPVLPSIINAQQELNYFTSTGKINFPDEVGLGTALAQVYYRTLPQNSTIETPEVDVPAIRKILKNVEDGFLDVAVVKALLDAVGLPQVADLETDRLDKAKDFAKEIGFPLVMKVVGPVHKTDVDGVSVGLRRMEQVEAEFSRLMQINGAKSVLIQPMLSGIELFIGAKREKQYGHLVLFGLGGIFIEVFEDVRAVLGPCKKQEILGQLQKLKGYKILKGYRGKEGINIDLFIEYIMRVGALLRAAPEISEIDINPLFAVGDEIRAVDVRVKVKQ